MAGFSLIADPQNTEYRVVRTSGSQAYTIGDAVMMDTTSDAVDVVPATASSTTVNIFGVAMETIVSTTTSLLVCVATAAQSWVAPVTNTANTNHNYQKMLLTDKVTVNNTGTTNTSANAVFTQLGVVSTNRIVGRFNVVANVTA